MHYKCFGRVERGTGIKLSNIAKIARGLGISMVELLSYCFPQKMLSKRAEEIKDLFINLLMLIDKGGKEKDLEHVEAIIRVLKHFRIR